MLRLLRDLLRFLWMRRKPWLIPVVLALLLAGVLAALAATSPMGPFIYPLF